MLATGLGLHDDGTHDANTKLGRRGVGLRHFHDCFVGDCYKDVNNNVNVGNSKTHDLDVGESKSWCRWFIYDSTKCAIWDHNLSAL